MHLKRALPDLLLVGCQKLVDGEPVAQALGCRLCAHLGNFTDLLLNGTLVGIVRFQQVAKLNLGFLNISPPVDLFLRRIRMDLVDVLLLLVSQFELVHHALLHHHGSALPLGALRLGQNHCRKSHKKHADKSC